MVNKSIGKLIGSDALIATAADSRNDVISTSAVLAATLISGFTGLRLDGPMGILVALFILWSGISLVRETIDIKETRRIAITLIHKHIIEMEARLTDIAMRHKTRHEIHIPRL